MTWQPIVAGVDGSPESFRAASLAWRIARAADARCVLVHAVPEVWSPGGMAPLVNSPDIFDQFVSDIREQLRREVGAEVPEAIRQALVARPGRPGVVLDEVIREVGASLVVVGGRHHGALARGLGGSTAHHLVRTSPAPVLVVAASSGPQRILVATDLFGAAGPTLSVAGVTPTCWTRIASCTSSSPPSSPRSCHSRSTWPYTRSGRGRSSSSSWSWSCHACRRTTG
jgi:nucleotide-binding universal stress UspA family protein